MIDIFSTHRMLAAVENLKTAPQFLLDRFFPLIQTEPSEEIHFDVINKGRRLAPFVSPVVAGKIVESNGVTSHSFRPAYIKDKRRIDANRPLKRTAGESVGGTLSPEERLLVIRNLEMQDQIDMINRRLEVMAAEALRTGAVIVSGDEYPTQNVDFGRDPSLTVALAGAALWSDASAKPMDDLQDWADMVLKMEGIVPMDVVMSVDVWKVFRGKADVQNRLDLRRADQANVNLGAQQIEGGVFRGAIDGFNIFTYSGWYLDDAGTEQPILPAGTVIMSGAGMQGVRAFGAIRDEDAGFQAVPYYPKSWVEQDPSARMLLMQSAPLVVPTRVNASLAATVL